MKYRVRVICGGELGSFLLCGAPMRQTPQGVVGTPLEFDDWNAAYFAGRESECVVSTGWPYVVEAMT